MAGRGYGHLLQGDARGAQGGGSGADVARRRSDHHGDGGGLRAAAATAGPGAGPPLGAGSDSPPQKTRWASGGARCSARLGVLGAGSGAGKRSSLRTQPSLAPPSTPGLGRSPPPTPEIRTLGRRSPGMIGHMLPDVAASRSSPTPTGTACSDPTSWLPPGLPRKRC